MSSFRTFGSLLLCFAAMVSANQASGQIRHSFDSDAQGWTAVDLDTVNLGNAAYTSAGVATQLNFRATGGNPGGYIDAADPSDLSFFFHAPSSFLGLLSAYQGGTLSFETFYLPHDNEWRGDPDVIISNGSTTLFYQGTSNPGASWTHISTTLAPGLGWSVGSFGGAAPTVSDFASVLANTTLLRLRGEYYAGVAETTGLDNVSLLAVPEADNWLMLIIGIVLILIVRRVRPKLDRCPPLANAVP